MLHLSPVCFVVRICQVLYLLAHHVANRIIICHTRRIYELELFEIPNKFSVCGKCCHLRRSRYGLWIYVFRWFCKHWKDILIWAYAHFETESSIQTACLPARVCCIDVFPLLSTEILFSRPAEYSHDNIWSWHHEEQIQIASQKIQKLCTNWILDLISRINDRNESM